MRTSYSGPAAAVRVRERSSVDASPVLCGTLAALLPPAPSPAPPRSGRRGGVVGFASELPAAGGGGGGLGVDDEGDGDIGGGGGGGGGEGGDGGGGGEEGGGGDVATRQRDDVAT